MLVLCSRLKLVKVSKLWRKVKIKESKLNQTKPNQTDQTLKRTYEHRSKRKMSNYYHRNRNFSGVHSPHLFSFPAYYRDKNLFKNSVSNQEYNGHYRPVYLDI